MRYKIDNHIIQVSSDQVVINNDTVTQQDKIIKAFDLFLQSKNQVVSKDTLMQALWGDLIVSDDSLFKIIQELRKILSAHEFSDDTLINVYGKGYKVRPQIQVFDETPLQTSTSPAKSLPTRLYFIGAVLVILALLFYFWSSQSKQDKINPIEYQQLKQAAEINSAKVKKNLLKDYNQSELSVNDQIKIQYLLAFDDFKKGKYAQSLKKIQKLKVLSKETNPNVATADALLLSAVIHYYQNNNKMMNEDIIQAENIYQTLNDAKGLLMSQFHKGKYYFAIGDYSTSVSTLKNLINKAKETQDSEILLKSYAALLEIYFVQDDFAESEKWTQSLLKLAVEENSSSFMSFAYGLMSKFSLLKGNFVKSMEFAQLTIRYAIEKNDTNRFQQSFSHFYNILNALGHQQLAVKYLNQAIAFQASRNKQGHLDEAELNLGIIQLQNHQYAQADHSFEQILSYPLSQKEALNVEAWLALSKYFKQDYIGAYSLAKEVYDEPKSNNPNKIIAGIAMVLSDLNLERNAEAQQIFDKISHIKMDNLLIEKAFFLEAALDLFENQNLEQYQNYLTEQHQLNTQLKHIKQETQPSQAFLTSLDTYLQKTSIHKSPE